MRPGLHLINLPKPERPEDVVAAALAIARAEAANGFQAGIDRPLGLLLNAALQLGLGDLFEPLGIARPEPSAMRQAMFTLRIAAGAAGMFAYDGAFADIRDIEGYRAEALLAKRLGFLGKSCIDPSQVAVANEVFRPDDAEIAHAQQVVAAAAAAAAAGTGAFIVDGRMVDRAFIARAEKTVALTRRLGLIPQSTIAS